MLHDEATILVVAPTLKKYYVEKSFRLVRPRLHVYVQVRGTLYLWTMRFDL